MSICSVEGCEGKIAARGLCNKHYLRLRLTGTTDDGPKAHGTLEQRFWRKVEKSGPNDCWKWTGKIEKNGYGRIQEGGKGSMNVGAHRVSYEIHHGPIPAGLYVLHSCDNPGCVNPKHLRVGTAKDNTADMYKRNRQGGTPPPLHFGEKQHCAVMTEDLVRQIRASDEPTRAWAEKLNVSADAIRSAKQRKTWKHVD